jgi:hypothetical protein
MIRLIGAITGSALALAALLVLVGVPQFKAQPKEIERAVVTLPLRTEPVARTAEAPELENALLPAETVAETVAETATQATVESSNEISPEPLVEIREELEVPIEQIQEVLRPDSLQWYAFWSPFRSEIAASGFVAQLQRVTGLDFRVVKLKPGVYEVAFAYAADEDIPVNLLQISAATGLDLPGN